MAAPMRAALARALHRPAVESTRVAGAVPADGDVDRAWGHFTRRHLIALTFMREHVPAIRQLEKGTWACLQALAPHWQAGRTDAYPGQERLAMLSGYDVRSIRTFTKTLEAGAFLEVVRVTLPDGTARLHYKPGQALLAAVEQFNAQYFDDRAQPDAERRVPPLEQAEIASRGHAGVVSGELPDPIELNRSSSFSPVSPEELENNEEQRFNPSEADREVAVEALAKLRERRFGRAAKVFDATVVAMVARCASVIDGDRETKLRAQLDAIEGAFLVSRGTPTPTFIWGSIDHFLEHEASGRKSRLECERARAMRAHEAKIQRELAREWALREREACGPPPEALKFMAELEKLSSAARPSSVGCKNG